MRLHCQCGDMLVSDPHVRVFLVGAGPGDPELLTIKAANAIAAADVIVYDRLVSDAILDMVPSGATHINVGKQPGHHPVPQAEINALLVRLARSGRTVVRLKGGDPFIFGRGSEEAVELRRNGIACQIVPGITSAQGAAAAAGIPLTHRGVASGVRYVTGHCRDDIDLDLDWDGMSDPRTTLVIYMGMQNIGQITTRLAAAGRSPSTPVIAINNATLSSERRVVATLESITRHVAAAGFVGPVLFVIGEVVSLHHRQSNAEEELNAPVLAAASG